MASITNNKGTCEPVPRNSVTANKITPQSDMSPLRVAIRGEEAWNIE
jgi:hypothetical protein